MNRFINSLSKICTDHLLEEKWLIAPTLRIGHQWAELACEKNAGILNLRPATLMGFALSIADPVMAKDNLQFVSSDGMDLIVDHSWQSTRYREGGYLSALEQTYGLIQAMSRMLTDILLAGIDEHSLDPGYFTSPEKGREIASLLEKYRNELSTKGIVDYPGILRIASNSVRKNPERFRTKVLVLIPGDVEFSALEDELISALPNDWVKALPVDEDPPDMAGWERSDSRFRTNRGKGGGSVQIFAAAGEVNEIRGVFRRCLDGQIPFDQVELLHTDTETYVPLIFETCQRHFSRSTAPADSLPITFAEGVPATLTRPGRALSEWLAWCENSFSYLILARMLSDGLLMVPHLPEGWSFAELAALLRKLAPVGNREDISARLGRRIEILKKRLSSSTGEEEETAGTGLERNLEGLKILRNFLSELLNISPAVLSDPTEIMECSISFLENFARCADRLDGYAQKHLSEEIQNMHRWVIMYEGSFCSIDFVRWLYHLPDTVRIAGSGPQPGKIHVAHALTGGHSGRTHTFITGLDEGRFPGVGLQDPLLLDTERRNLSANLSLSGDLVERKLTGFWKLLSRVRGNVTLSFSARNLDDDREIFPSQVILSIYRLLKDPDADLKDLMNEVWPPDSFAPSNPKQALDLSEWLVSRLLQPGGIAEPQALLSSNYPHLSQGRLARKHRSSDILTGYDGLISQPGSDMDPTNPAGPIMSASRLETIGRCPMLYFFRYVLRLDPPEDDTIDRGIWLEPLEYGRLLHRVFQLFMSRLLSEGLRPDFSRDEGMLLKLLDEEIDSLYLESPPNRQSLLERDRRRGREAARIFLREEERFCRTHEPLFMEASIGIRRDISPTILDCIAPMLLDLPGGKSLRARGRIDRVDRSEAAGGEHYVVTDYKSGSDSKYRHTDPFWQGRVVQHAFYLALTDRRLKETVSKKARAIAFRFLFPSEKTRGESVILGAEDLSRSDEILSHLCEIAATGTFIPTTNGKDCDYCEFAGILCEDDPHEISAASRAKLKNEKNPGLTPIRLLRGDK